MKITVTKTDVEVEGEAYEIAEALPAILTPTITQIPASVSRSLNTIDASKVTPPAAAPQHRDIELPHERVAAMESEWDDVAAPTGPTSPTPTTRLERFADVPMDRRVLGANGQTCHVAKTPNDPDDLYCGHGVGMARRRPVPGIEPAVCGNCNRAIEREARP